MGAGHDHGADVLRAGREHIGRLKAAVAIMAALMLIEAATGLWSGSIALLSEAGHMFTDVLGMGMALAALLAVHGSRARPRDPQRTFGLYRLEVLTALANAVLLSGVAIAVVINAVTRLTEPPTVDAGPMLVVATLAIAANIAAFLLLRPGAKDNLNLRGASLEVLSDLFGAAGVLAAGLVIHFTGWWYADPVAAIAVGVFILPRTWKLARTAVRILVQAAPNHLNVTDVQQTLGDLDGVADVHDLHVWTLASGMEVASAHLTLDTGADVATVLDLARERLHNDFHIEHATLQVEPPRQHPVCQSVTW